ncbi:carbohydrate ABC transporter permease [Brachybacterium tyrofermentans]|uniref:carbohydrate ABC transporter permease n=1 Tax=Brachybacterium tyrofermentans TaxID=47848 RepID=UPI003FCF4D0D
MTAQTTRRTHLAPHSIVAATRKKALLPTVIGTAIIIAFCIYFLFPVFWQLIASTKTTSQLASTSGVVPTIPPHTFDNLRALFTAEDGIFGRWFVNSLIYSGIGGALCTLISAATGYALALLRFRGKTFITAAVLVGTLLPATVLAFPIYLVVVRLGIVDTYWAYLLPSLVSPMAIFLGRMFAQQSIPKDLLEAARIDGAGEMRIAFTIGLRLMTPGLVTIFLIQVIAIWNNFLLPLMVLSSSEKYPATVGLYIWNSRVTQSPEYTILVLLGALVSSLPLIVLFLWLQRYLKSGMTSGAVKA